MIAKKINYNKLTLEELKKLCKKNGLKKYSMLNKDNIVKLLKKFYKKGGSIENPVINVYVYGIVNKEFANNGIRINPHKTYQKFNNFYKTKDNNNGIIYPSKYVTENLINHTFDQKTFINDGKYYSNDPVTSIKPQLVGSSKENIKNYYDFYLSKLTKVKEFQNSGKKFYNYTKFNNMIETIENANIKLIEYLTYNSDQTNKKFCASLEESDIKKKHYGAYIFNINIEENEKVLLFGDFHGSYHTFFRIFVRLHILGVIDFINYKINDGYRLIFLGDIADRGQYAMEIYYILSKFILNNNTNEKLKLILNRGNHEHYEMWKSMNYSFLNELNKKIEIIKNKGSENNIDEIYYLNIFITFLSHCSSAIILNYGEKKYWLCHGGFPTGINESSSTFKIPHKSKLISFYESNYYNDPSKSIFYENIPEQIRWSDFHDLDKTIYDTRIKIGLSKLKKFFIVNKINFIIRGHNDDYENAFLISDDTKIPNIMKKYKVIDKNPGLISYPNYPYFVLGLNNESIYNLNKDTGKSSIIFPSQIKRNKYIHNLKQTNGPIISLKTNNWLVFPSGSPINKLYTHTVKNSNTSSLNSNTSNNNNNNSNNNKQNIKVQKDLYPVLTISTNSDLNRLLNNDSFIVLNFSNDNDDFNNLEEDQINMFFKNIKNIDSNINLSNVAQIPTRVNLNQNNKNVNSIWKNSENP
jgi:hypothetical protein